MITNVAELYEFSLLQMVAEAYLEGVALTNQQAVFDAVNRGNNRPGFVDQAGATRLTRSQFDEFWTRYAIKDQLSDYGGDGQPAFLPGSSILANSGLSATLIQEKGTDRYTLAIRSTEFKTLSDGGDRPRDVLGADLLLSQWGFAWAQVDALERFYDWLRNTGMLPSNAILNVTGYSLGGHLATVFTELHASAVNQTVTFNGAGRGTWVEGTGISEMLTSYRALIVNPGARPIPEESDLWPAYDAAYAAHSQNRPWPIESIYDDPRHQWATLRTKRNFTTSYDLYPDPTRTNLTAGAAQKITQVYARELPQEVSFVANTGVHGPALGVFF